MTLDHSYATLDARLYHKQPPTPMKNPRAGHFNAALAKKLTLDANFDDGFWQENWVSIIGGEFVPKAFDPLAMVYAGHQFGIWAGQLGDGRGLLLTQVRSSEGKLWDLHLKGAGLTPYSRMGDGRAVLRSVIREYLAGHALNSLGIASSDALGFVVSDSPVQRERLERGAAMLRIADTHIRLGHFEWINSYAPELLAEFVNYCISTYFPECLDAADPVISFAQNVVNRTAKMIADWQLIGFCHGVMNTDNLSITGSTLDFGPFAFMERFNPNWIFNHTDTQGRYTYQNQPMIAHWNLSVWLGQISKLGNIENSTLVDILDSFEPTFLAHYKTGMAKKLGLKQTAAAFDFGMAWLTLLQDEKLDYTNSFRVLSSVANAETINHTKLKKCVRNHIDAVENVARFDSLIHDYAELVADTGLDDRTAVMNAANPVYILRTHMAQTAIEQAELGDFSEVSRLFELLSKPYGVSDLAKPADTLAPAKDADMVVLSCSS